MAWNFTQHSNHDITHLHRFGTPPHIILQGLDASLQHLIALQDLLRTKTDNIQTSNMFTRALNPYHRYYSTVQTFTTNQLVWLHLRNFGLRKEWLRKSKPQWLIYVSAVASIQNMRHATVHTSKNTQFHLKYYQIITSKLPFLTMTWPSRSQIHQKNTFRNTAVQWVIRSAHNPASIFWDPPSIPPYNNHHFFHTLPSSISSSKQKPGIEHHD